MCPAVKGDIFIYLKKRVRKPPFGSGSTGPSIHEPLEQEPGALTAAAIGPVVPFFARPAACQIHMGPGGRPHELAEEQAGGDGSAPADAGDVLQIGQGALEQLG